MSSDPAAFGFGVLLEDEAVLAVDKPAGIATQAPKQFDSLEARIRGYLAAQGNAPDAIYLGIPHRLDRAVTGAIVFAKTRRAARQLSKQFERRQVQKLYWACVERTVDPPAATWTDYLRKVHGRPRTEVVPAMHPEAQEAVLHYRTLGYHPAGSWLEIELATGRTHQIRVQCSTRGHAVLGDAFYGAIQPFGPPVAEERERPIALHARLLAFTHPLTRASITIEAPPPATWQTLALTPRADANTKKEEA